MTIQYDICLSFAGEDREFVEQVANRLRYRGVSVFYDDYERVDLWGKDLYVHLDNIYRKAAIYCVVFISKHYATKLWTNHERRSSQARAFKENREYILPAKFDDTELPGLPPTIGYIDLQKTTSEELADLIAQKLNLLDGKGYNESSPSSTARQFIFFSDKVIVPEIQWPSNTLIDANSTFQLLPTNYTSEKVRDIVKVTLSHLKELRNSEDGYWTHGEDREFDRVYATTSVLTYLFQLGLQQDHLLINSANAYLDERTDISMSNRATILFQIAFHRIKEDKTILFLKTLQDYQYKEHNSPFYGSFMLPQGPEIDPKPTTDHWQTHRYHSEGASFHACHIADILLHMQPDFVQARNEAKIILNGITQYIENCFKKHSGFLPDLYSQPSKMTLLAYALAKPLRIALPPNWIECVVHCIENLKKENNWLLRAFGIMNLHYITRMHNNTELHKLASEHVGHELALIWDERERFFSNARDISVFGRTFLYGYRFINCDAGAYFLRAASEDVCKEE